METENRIANILKNSPLKENRRESLELLLSILDLTTLEGKDNEEKIISVCQKAKSYISYQLPNVAAVCFYPPFARLAKQNLENSGIKVACVAGAFPSGQSSLEIRLAEVRYAIEQGADEIDMVISRGKFLEGDYDYIAREVRGHKENCGNAHLKVILETGELGSLENIRKASEIAIANGADFIKTSTGKTNPAATLEAFICMLDVIKEEYQKSGKMIGIKPAGGISEAEDALQYLYLLHHVLGEKWMNKEYFRIGASRLADSIFNELKR